MHTRPTSLVGAVMLVAATGVAALFVAALLGILVAGAIPILDGRVTLVAWLIAGAAAAYGLAGVVAAVGLWQRHGWAWPIAAAVQVVGSLGAIVAIASSGPQLPTLVGTALVLAGLVAVVAPDTRRAVAT